MKCSTKYAALDVHRATTVASVREEGGRVLVCNRRVDYHTATLSHA
jgi:hypothetical protein